MGAGRAKLDLQGQSGAWAEMRRRRRRAEKETQREAACGAHSNAQAEPGTEKSLCAQQGRPRSCAQMLGAREPSASASEHMSF